MTSNRCPVHDRYLIMNRCPACDRETYRARLEELRADARAARVRRPSPPPTKYLGEPIRYTTKRRPRPSKVIIVIGPDGQAYAEERPR